MEKLLFPKFEPQIQLLLCYIVYAENTLYLLFSDLESFSFRHVSLSCT